MSDTLTFPTDHGAVAWGHFLAQHLGKVQTADFVTAFYPPLNVLDNAFYELYTNRWLETAEGLQLDGIGSIVGQSRSIPNSVYLAYFGFASQIAGRAFGVARLRHKREPYAQSSLLGDEQYRVILNLKIALNNGHGTAEDLMYAFNTTLDVTRTRIEDVGNANARVYINDFIMSNDPRSQLLDYMMPKMAGVKLHPYYVDADHTFGFMNQNIYFGFDIGILARQPGSNIPPLNITISIWDRGESNWDGGVSIWDQLGA
jgi:hypothetical protein